LTVEMYTSIERTSKHNIVQKMWMTNYHQLWRVWCKNRACTTPK